MRFGQEQGLRLVHNTPAQAAGTAHHGASSNGLGGHDASHAQHASAPAAAAASAATNAGDAATAATAAATTATAAAPTGTSAAATWPRWATEHFAKTHDDE